MAYTVARHATTGHVQLRWGVAMYVAAREAETWPCSCEAHSNGAYKAEGGQQCGCKGARGATT